MIDSYSFGRIVINGRAYTSDLMIFPDGRVQDSWWRQEGHSLSMNDLAELILAKPNMIIAGTGFNGLMTPDVDLENRLRRKGIEFRALPSAEAVRLYNEMASAGKVGACFHLTC